jgi:hypothetical protein
MTYWILLKSGHLEIRERAPKNKVYVEETSTEVKGDFQHYHHVWRLFGTASKLPIREEQFESYHGQDRGPTRERLIRTMILSVIKI